MVLPPTADQPSPAARRVMRIAGEALPPELAHLATGALGDALAKAVNYSQRSVSPTTEKIYSNDWNAFRNWCLDQVIAAVGRSRACPFDLHALLLVPDARLRQGPDDPASNAWLRRRWGTIQPLRHVRRHEDPPDRRRRHSARLQYDFRSADWTPWAAFASLRKRWPALVFDFRPDYRDG
jgi:hypothetical protein